MLTTELDYELPEALIAQRPPPERAGARLLVLGAGDTPADDWVANWPQLVPPNALVVLNDTRVLRSRVFARRVQTEGKVELLFLAPVDAEEPGGPWTALARANRPLKVGSELKVDGVCLRVVSKASDGSVGIQSDIPVLTLLLRVGHVPLPPYMRREDEVADQQRYQTVFAKYDGSAAAPTAGLHLTDEMLGELMSRGARIGYVTLHVGAGTFRPVSTETLQEHPMHSERFTVSSELAAQVKAARAEGRPIVAVGTTVVRALESAADKRGGVIEQTADTKLMILPGFQFSVVDALLTNFHAPRSTLMALVQAFAGAPQIRAAYADAVQRNYRFLSYGDAMWLPQRLA